MEQATAEAPVETPEDKTARLNKYQSEMSAACKDIMDACTDAIVQRDLYVGEFKKAVESATADIKSARRRKSGDFTLAMIEATTLVAFEATSASADELIELNEICLMLQASHNEIFSVFGFVPLLVKLAIAGDVTDVAYDKLTTMVHDRMTAIGNRMQGAAARMIEINARLQLRRDTILAAVQAYQQPDS